MKHLPLAVILISFIFLWMACRKDNVKKLECNATEGCQWIEQADSCACNALSAVCDTGFTLSYANDIEPILYKKHGNERSCYDCHDAKSPDFSRGLGIRLDGYNALKVYVDNGQLLCAIKQTGCSNAVSMPYLEGKMSDCDILRIEAWINQGAKNN
ncbi:MAG: hypothetical protein KatS3mg031_2312 [Chitinophagales bacterium]|nr:MAG: hypothetical protein KatS3mg031_2312 [Chitinophagales bacterium]